MAKNTGKNQAISFGGTIYRCISTGSMDGSVGVASAECSEATGNATTHKAVGAETWTASYTIITDDDSIDLETDLALGTTGELIVYPHGDITGLKEFTWTSSFVASDGESVDVGGFATMNVTFECSGARTPGLVAA